MTIAPEQIKALRERTGLSVMDCKQALEQTSGDMEQAMLVLRKKSSAAAAKKSERELKAGVVQSYVHSSKNVGTIVLLSCETDFVAKNEEFVALARDIAMHATATAPSCISREHIATEDVARAQALFEQEAADKPEAMRTAIIAGKIESYYKDRVLLEQEYIKDPKTTIQGLVEAATQKFGERIEVSECTRLAV